MGGNKNCRHKGRTRSISSLQMAMPTLRKASWSRQFPVRKNVGGEERGTRSRVRRAASLVKYDGLNVETCTTRTRCHVGRRARDELVVMRRRAPRAALRCGGTCALDCDTRAAPFELKLA